MSALQQQALEMLAQALNVEAAALDETAAPGDTPGWDSLAHMRLVAALEVQLGRALQPLEIVSIGSPVDVAALLHS